MALEIKSLIPVFTSEQIAKRVAELGAQITKDYGDEELIAVCVLKGAVIFYTDLVRQIKNKNLMLDFLRVSSYGANTTSSHEVRFIKDVDINVSGKHVLLVEDVIDSGLTMSKVFEHFRLRGAKSIRLCALIDKRERRVTNINIDYSGFELKKGFIVGFGLDLAEKYRQLPAVYEAVIEEK